jgi:photosystem II stability/assembly factor-like uncharacterized protein
MEVQFIDVAKGIAVGEHGVILSTLDGGTTWTPVSSGVVTTLTAVEFCSPMVGIADGAEGVILRTTDGGNSWTMVAGNCE